MASSLKDDENFIQNKYGYCFYSLYPPSIFNLYIHKEYRRMGHSRSLLEYAINEIRKVTNEPIIIEAIPKENSISQNDLTKYYKSFNLTIIQTEGSDV